MATVKLKFRPSTLSNHPGTIYYQITHHRVTRHITTPHHVYPDEWDYVKQPSDSCQPGSNIHLTGIRQNLQAEITQLNQIVKHFDGTGTPYTADDIVLTFQSRNDNGLWFIAFMRSVIGQMTSMGRIRIGETYTSTMQSFMRFRRGIDLITDSIDQDIIMEYEAYLKQEGVCRNTSSFYMRNLRSIYNRAVAKGFTTQRNPFRSVYTGVDKTVKRAISESTIKRIRSMDLSATPALAMARDMFLFSFYTRGMSFVDIAYLRKTDLNNDILSYRRKKTDQRLYVRWEKCMAEIADRYSHATSPYLLSVINPDKGDALRQYRNASHLINRKLKIIGQQLNLTAPLTMYCARHAWASIARGKNIPLSVISEAMGHDSEKTTRIYLASLDSDEVDNANSIILNSLIMANQ